MFLVPAPKSMTAWSAFALLCTVACVTAAPVVAAAPADDAAAPLSRDRDAFLAGYLEAVLERELGWPRGTFALTVEHGLATVTLPQEDEERRAQLTTRLPIIEGLQGVNVVVAAPAPAKAPPPTVRRRVYSFLGITPDTTPFPVGDLFLPLLADPKQPQFFASYRLYDTPTDRAHLAAVGFGETFGLYRREGERPGDGLQVSLAGALFAQFNLDAPSNDLVNADYTIGLPVTYRHRPWSMRLRVYHQSSHLGDEYLLRAHPQRVNLSFESAEFIGSYEWRNWRAYLGGEYLFHHEPADLKPGGYHGGLEYRGKAPLLFGGRLVGGVDLKSWQEHAYSVDTSLKVGLEFGAAQPGRRRLRVMAEGYRGYAPHGQFYDDKIRYFGVGVYLGF